MVYKVWRIVSRPIFIMSVVLGIDPSITSFGWCVYDGDRNKEDRVVARGRIKTLAGELEIRRYNFLQESFQNIINKYNPIFIGAESSPIGAGSYTEGLYALYITTLQVMYKLRKDVVYFAPLQVKMLAHGLGPSFVRPKNLNLPKMSKQEMVKLAKRSIGMTKGVFQSDEADAFHVAKATWNFWKFISKDVDYDDLSLSEQWVFAGEKTYKRGKKQGITEKKGISFHKNRLYFDFSNLGSEIDLEETGTIIQSIGE